MNEAGQPDTQHWLSRIEAVDGAESARARNALLTHAAGRLERLARAMLRGYPRLQRWEQTDDVLQNALLRLHQALESVRPATSREFYGLAALQIRRELIDLARRHFGPLGAAGRHLTAEVDQANLASAAADLAGRTGTLADWQAFHEEVDRLPEKERQIVNLLWYQGLKQGDAAELLGVAERTVKNRWQRARQLLEQKLNRRGWLDETPGETTLYDDRYGKLALPDVFAARYRREGLIAQGGFSQVWRATDLQSGQHVAVKVTTRDCLSEARRVARLQHHGIVTVRDAGQQSDFCFIVFDLVEGGDLAELLHAGPLDWRQAAKIVAEAALRLDFAHRQGFVHRDIKPANILVGADGEVVLADFGIAVTQEELSSETLTTAGTLAYMAPEQLRTPTRIDARTDVYGLGVVLYEALTGRRPFRGADLVELRRQILEDSAEPPSALNPGISAELDRICLRCLAKLPADRYPTAAALAQELAQAAQDGD